MHLRRRILHAAQGVRMTGGNTDGGEFGDECEDVGEKEDVGEVSVMVLVVAAFSEKSIVLGESRECWEGELCFHSCPAFGVLILWSRGPDIYSRLS